jgi:hypothetical protein
LPKFSGQICGATTYPGYLSDPALQRFHSLLIDRETIDHRSTHTHTSFEDAHGYISRLKPAPDAMALYGGFTGNPQEGQDGDMHLALVSTI